MYAVETKPLSRRALDGNARFSSSIGQNTKFTGSLSGDGNIVVQGKVVGDSEINAAVVITETGSWEGNLVAEVVVVSGEVTGNITASGKIELLASARVTGNLRCPVIAIATGAIHEGRMDMGSAMRVERFFEKRSDPAPLQS